MFDINNKIKLIIDGTLSAKENMNIDKELFDNFTKNSLPILRLYSWNKSCTIGMSQEFKKIPEIKEYETTYAKRITGGGILFHGHDISYSLLIPVSYMKTLNVKQSYEIICLFILNFYKSLGLDVRYAKDIDSIALSKDKFCQVGFEAYDIIVNNNKIGGNAQRRTKDIIFQHGSIPLRQTQDKLKYGYALEDLNLNLSNDDAKKKLANIFKNTFKVEFENAK